MSISKTPSTPSTHDPRPLTLDFLFVCVSIFFGIIITFGKLIYCDANLAIK